VTESYNFTQDFQDSILACLIRYPEEFYAFGEIIKPEYFTGPAACELVFRLNEYRTQFNKLPNFSTLGNFAFHKKARVNIDQAKETLDYVEKLSQVDTSDKEGILSMAIKFAKERAIYDAIRKIHAAQTEGKEDVDPVKVMQEAMSVGADQNDPGLSLYHDSDRIIDMVTNRDYGVQTGYAEFDRLWKFGWAPGWLIVLLAPPKRFKTAMALNLAVNIASKQDADVLYYACEISQELAGMRALTNITGWTQEQIFDSKEKAKLHAKAELRTKLWGNVWFKGFPSKSTTISEIKAHARRTINTYGLKPRAIIIDYAETVRPDSVDKKAPDWRQQADIYTQARALGAEFGCCVILPDRCNRETVGQQVPSMKSFQGAFEKAGIVDIAIGLCATTGEYKQDHIRYFVFLNRHGEAYKHYSGSVDPERMQMTVGGEIDYNPDAEDADTETKPRKASRWKRQLAEGTAITQND
jgi:replicative DNA helicase